MESRIRIITPSTPEEFEKLWRLNYLIFARELKMRPDTAAEMIVDKFHPKNIYRAAMETATGAFTGMISAHWSAPYSAAAHFGDTIAEPPLEGKLAEIRLFALLPGYRSTTLAAQLAVPLLQELDSRGVSEVIISGISNMRSFYEHLGFCVAGAPVKEGSTLLYPMRGKLSLILERCRPALERYSPKI